MKVAIYARVSTDDKEQNPDVQVMKCKQYCELHGHQIIKEFKEEGISGDTLIWERPEGKKLKEEISAGRVEGIVVFSVDRYSRQSPNKVLQQLTYLKESSIKFISVSEPVFNMESEFSELLQYFLTWFSSYFLVQHRKKVKAGMERAKAKGTRSGAPIGRQPISGWHKNRIIEYHNGGMSMKKIAKELNLSVGVVHKTLHKDAEGKNPPENASSEKKSLMNEAEAGDKVELTEDLTRYHPKLIIGAKGIAEEFEVGGVWAKSQPGRFVSVVFDEAGRWDILRKGLKVLEKR